MFAVVIYTRDDASATQDLVEVLKKQAAGSIASLDQGAPYKSILEAVEKPIIEHALERADGNQLKAARALGINRNTLRSKIKKLGINLRRWKIAE